MSVPQLRSAVWFEPATHLAVVFAVFAGLWVWAGDGLMAAAYALGALGWLAFGHGTRHAHAAARWGGLALGLTATAFTAARVWLTQG